MLPVPGRLSLDNPEDLPGGQERYLSFCQCSDLQPVPVAEENLCWLVTFLQVQGLHYLTVKLYILAVGHLQIYQGDSQMSSVPTLELVVRGLKREQAGSPSKLRLLITPAILRQVHSYLKGNQDWNDVMLWAVMSLSFFGFLRSGQAGDAP